MYQTLRVFGWGWLETVIAIMFRGKRKAEKVNFSHSFASGIQKHCRLPCIKSHQGTPTKRRCKSVLTRKELTRHVYLLLLVIGVEAVASESTSLPLLFQLFINVPSINTVGALQKECAVFGLALRGGFAYRPLVIAPLWTWDKATLDCHNLKSDTTINSIG